MKRLILVGVIVLFASGRAQAQSLMTAPAADQRVPPDAVSAETSPDIDKIPPAESSLQGARGKFFKAGTVYCKKSPAGAEKCQPLGAFPKHCRPVKGGYFCVDEPDSGCVLSDQGEVHCAGARHSGAHVNGKNIESEPGARHKATSAQ